MSIEESEEEADTSDYLHLFVSEIYDVYNIRDLVQVSFYLVDDNGEPISDVVTRDLIFGSPENVILPQFNNYNDVYATKSTFTLYGYATPGETVSVSNYYTDVELASATANVYNGRFEVTLTNLTDGELYLIVSDDSGITKPAYCTLIVDQTAPVIESVNFVFDEETGTAALHWECEDTDVNHFNVYRDKELIENYLSQTSRQITVNARPDDGHSFTVRAYDHAGNVGELTRSTADQVAPSAPESLIATDTTTNTITLQWSEATDNIGILGYIIYMDDKELVRLDNPSLTYTIENLECGKEYTFSVKSRDKAGNLSDSFSPTLKISTVKLLATVEMQESYIVDSYPMKQIPVTYTVKADKENYSVILAKAQLEFRADSAEDWSIQQWSEETPAVWNISGKDEEGYLPKGNYELRVRAWDVNDNEVVSDPANIVVLSIDEEKPTTPGVPTAVSHNTTSITFSWTPSEDNVAVKEYRISCDGTEVATVTHTEAESYLYSLVNLSSGSHKISVQAIDLRGNISNAASAELSTMILAFDSVKDFEEAYVLEDHYNKEITLWAKFKPEEGYAPVVTMSMEYKAEGASEWISVPLAVSEENPNYFSHTFHGISLKDFALGTYVIRFAIADNDTLVYSDEQNVMLTPEKEPPVVTSIEPSGSTLSGKELSLIAWATDNVAVKTVTFSYSYEDTNQFVELAVAQFRDEEEYAECVWENASELPSGVYTIKAEARDARGNVGEKTTTVTLDNDAPVTPSAVTATASSRYIHVMWDRAYVAPKDFDRFCVYRADAVNGEYTQVANIKTIGFYDIGTTAEADVTYYYYVTAVDTLGNESEPSPTVSATFISDTESPVIDDMRPKNGATLRKSCTLQVIASDNYRLGNAVFYYRAVNSETWTKIGQTEIDDIRNSYLYLYDWEIPAGLDGEYQIKAEVFDASSSDLDVSSGCVANSPATIVRNVVIKRYSPPAAPVVAAESGYKKAELSWSYNGDTETLNQFVVYQTNSSGEDREYVTTVSADAIGSASAVIPSDGEQYFVVVAQDIYGETAESSVVSVTSLPKETEPPKAVITPTSLKAARDVAFTFSGVNSTDNDVIASYLWDFGDGCTSTDAICTHTYTEAGNYSVSLTVTDESGNKNIATATMTVYDILGDDADHVLATISVVNAYEDNTPGIEGAEVKVTVKDSSETITFESAGITANDGTFTAVLPKGEVNVAATADGYLATSRSVTVDSDESGHFAYTVGMTPMNVSMVDGSLSVTEMTYDEIVDAGIDVTDPDNNHVWKFSVELEFVAAPALPFDLPSLPITGYYNSAGTFLGGSGWGLTSLGGSGSAGGGAGCGMNIGVFPISESFLLVIYGEAHWLKEMYNVELIVINNSYVDDITECQATLTLPDGLSLAAMTGTAQSETIDIGTIPHKTSADDDANTTKANWYLRGDKEGEYNLTATVTGNNPEPFVKQFTTDKPVKVYAGSALKLHIRAEDIAYRGEEYHVQFELENISHKDLYNLSFGITGAEQFKVIRIGDAEETITLTQEDFGDNMTQKIKTLKPGESIIIDFYTTVWFNSLLELVDMGPLDAGYYLTGVFVTTLEGSSTSIPYDISLLPSSHGTFFEWLADEATEAMEDGVIDLIEKEFLSEIPLISTGKKFYEFAHNGEAASRCEISLGNGTFVVSDNLLRSRTFTRSQDNSAIHVYTDSTNYKISADGKTMVIDGDAKIYVEGASAGKASMEVTTYVVEDDGTEIPHVYTMNYTVSSETGEADDLILQAPVVGITDGKTAVPLAGEEKKITFPYVLITEDGTYLNQAENAQWTVTGDDTSGVQIENGVLTIESCAKGGDYTVTLTVDDKSAAQTITLTRDPSIIQTLQISRGGVALNENDAISLAGSYTYIALATDQYGVSYEVDAAWNVSGSVAGVNVSDNTLTVGSNVAAGSLTLTAAADSKQATIVIAIIDESSLTFEINNTSTGATITLNNIGNVSVDVQCIAAAYDSDERMVRTDASAGTLTSNDTLTLNLSYKESDLVTIVRVFVLNKQTNEPLTAILTNP